MKATAEMLQKGEGAVANLSEAKKWLHLAAVKGDGISQYKLAEIYGSGVGALHDNITAHMWANIAASNGIGDAAELRQFIEKQMDKNELKIARQLARQCKETNYKSCIH